MAGVVFETTNQIIQDAAYELGLIQSDISDVFASTDQNIIQLRNLLNRVCRTLLKERQWSQLQAEGTITTANGTADYDLPADFDRTIDDTYWDRTSSLKVGGPIGPREWQYLKVWQVSGTITEYLRIKQNKVSFIATPSAVLDIRFEYMSSYWVAATPGTTRSANRTTVSTDVIWFDPTLVLLGLKAAFLKAKGFDATEVERDYQRQLSHAGGADGAARVLSLSPGRSTGLVGVGNLPDSGTWGS